MIKYTGSCNALALLLLAFIIMSAAEVMGSTFPELEQLPLRTAGRWIVDQQGNRVKLACVNWHGGHMNTFAPSGLDYQPASGIAATLRKLGFNCVRLNWSVELVQTNPIIDHRVIKAVREHGEITDDGARALDVLDVVIKALAAEKIMTIIDNHISDAGWCCDVRTENGLWFNERYPVDVWEKTWEFMAERYVDNLYVIGADLRNELRPDIRFNGKISWRSMPNLVIKMPTWGGGDKVLPLKEYAPEVLSFNHPSLNSTKHRLLLFAIKRLLANVPVQLFDWHAASQQAANKVIAKNPNLLVFIQGTFDIFSYTPNVVKIILYYMNNDKALYNSVGKLFAIPKEATKVYQLQNFTGVDTMPIKLDQPNRLVYSAHLYPFFYDSAQYEWDGISPTYKDYSETVDKFWGYIFKNKTMPVWVGETGTKASMLGIGSKWTDYNNRYLIENDLDFAYWPIGDARPTIDKETGEFVHGFDKFALLNQKYDGLKYGPLYDTLKPLFVEREGPGVTPQNNRHILYQN